MKHYLIERSREPSTWRGMILLLTAIGVPIEPGLVEPIISVGLAAAGLIGVLAADR